MICNAYIRQFNRWPIDQSMITNVVVHATLLAPLLGNFEYFYVILKPRYGCGDGCRRALPIAVVVGVAALAGLYFYLNSAY